MPVSLPPDTSSTFARASSKPSVSATRDANAVKPPETSTAVAPFAFIVATSARPPGM